MDIDPETLNLDSQKVLEAIDQLGKKQGKVKAILPVHIGGYPCDLDEIYGIAHRYNLAVVEDAAHALPTRYKGKLIGSGKLKIGEVPMQMPDTRYQMPEKRQIPDARYQMPEDQIPDARYQMPEKRQIPARRLEGDVRDPTSVIRYPLFDCFYIYATNPHPN